MVSYDKAECQERTKLGERLKADGLDHKLEDYHFSKRGLVVTTTKPLPNAAGLFGKQVGNDYQYLRADIVEYVKSPSSALSVPAV